MNTYDSMSDYELDVEIAKRLGYTVKVKTVNNLTWGELYMPDGSEAQDGEGYLRVAYGNMEQAWYRLAPEYASDANLALELVEDFWIQLGKEKHGDYRYIAMVSTMIGKYFTAYHKTSIARAIATAWLLHDDARKDSE